MHMLLILLKYSYCIPLQSMCYYIFATSSNLINNIRIELSPFLLHIWYMVLNGFVYLPPCKDTPSPDTRSYIRKKNYISLGRIVSDS